MDNGTFTTIDGPDGIDTRALGINSAGQVVGVYLTNDLLGHGFFWDKGVITTLDHPDALANRGMCRVRVIYFKPSEDGVRESSIPEFSDISSIRQGFSDTNLAAFSGWIRLLQRLPEIE